MPGARHLFNSPSIPKLTGNSKTTWMLKKLAELRGGGCFPQFIQHLFSRYVFPKWGSSLQTVLEAYHFTRPIPFKWPPSPFGDYWKSYYFLLQLTVHPGLFHWWKQAKPTLCVCLLEKIASFIYRPLALFSQWIPGLNAISQETLPMCSPVIPHCLQAESNTARGKGGRGGGDPAQHCQP